VATGEEAREQSVALRPVQETDDRVAKPAPDDRVAKPAPDDRVAKPAPDDRVAKPAPDDRGRTTCGCS